MRYVLAVVLGGILGALLANLLIGRRLLRTARMEVQTEITRIAPYLDRTLEDMEQFIGVMRNEIRGYVELAESQLPAPTIIDQLPERVDE